MPRYIALLRAINVGGHVVKMEKLRQLFGELGFSKIATFINSGNVIFDSRSADCAALEKKIEKHLEVALGYPVAAFLRTPAELATICEHRPFADAPMFHIGFLVQPLADGARDALLKFQSQDNLLHVHGREIYWLTRVGQAQSKFNNAVCERAIEARATFRNINTVSKLAEKYST